MWSPAIKQAINMEREVEWDMEEEKEKRKSARQSAQPRERAHALALELLFTTTDSAGKRNGWEVDWTHVKSNGSPAARAKAGKV